MSYCRFSSDDFQCDLYVFEDVAGGFTTHVAGSRCVFHEPLPPDVPYPLGAEPGSDAVKKWFARHQKVMAMVEAAERVDIGLPHDGESFNDVTANDCADRLERLRAIGYRVPQYAIDALREE